MVAFLERNANLVVDWIGREVWGVLAARVEILFLVQEENRYPVQLYYVQKEQRFDS